MRLVHYLLPGLELRLPLPQLRRVLLVEVLQLGGLVLHQHLPLLVLRDDVKVASYVTSDYFCEVNHVYYYTTLHKIAYGTDRKTCVLIIRLLEILLQHQSIKLMMINSSFIMLSQNEFNSSIHPSLKLFQLLDGRVGGGPRLLQLPPVLRLEPLLLGAVPLLLRLLELEQTLINLLIND